MVHKYAFRGSGMVHKYAFRGSGMTHKNKVASRTCRASFIDPGTYSVGGHRVPKPTGKDRDSSLRNS